MDTRMRNNDGGVLLKGRGNRRDRQALLHGLDGLRIISHEKIHLARKQELQPVDLWTTHSDFDLETVFAINAFRDGLIKTAMFCLCIPVGAKNELRQGLRVRHYARAVSESEH